MTERTFPVVEIFGPTIQGEGALAGRPTHFIRFGGCDYRCAWCDSAPAVLPEEVRKAEKLDAWEVINRVWALPVGPKWVTISGGNPALHDLDFLVGKLQTGSVLKNLRPKDGAKPFKVAVETQGTIFREWLNHVDLLTVSPKPPSSGNISSLEVVERFFKKYDPSDNAKAVIKVVVFDEADYRYACSIAAWANDQFYPFYLSVGTYMGGLDGTFAGERIDGTKDILERYRWLVELVAREPLLASAAVYPQLHALIWGHERGH